MANFTGKKFIDLEGLKSFHDRVKEIHVEPLSTTISTVTENINNLTSDLEAHEAASEESFVLLEEKLANYVMATDEEVQEMIGTADVVYEDMIVENEVVESIVETADEKYPEIASES